MQTVLSAYTCVHACRHSLVHPRSPTFGYTCDATCPHHPQVLPKYPCHRWWADVATRGYLPLPLEHDALAFVSLLRGFASGSMAQVSPSAHYHIILDINVPRFQLASSVRVDATHH